MKERLLGIWNKAYCCCESRPHLKPVQFGMRCIKKGYYIGSKVFRAARRDLFTRKFRIAVVNTKQSPPPMPISYIPADPTKSWPTTPGAYVRLDYWVKPASGGSYGHTCYVAKELDRLTPGLTCLMANRYPLLTGFGVSECLLLAKQKNASSEALIIQGREYEKHVAKWVQDNKPSFIYERLCLGSMAAAKAARQFSIPYIVEYNGSEIEMSRSYSQNPMEYAQLLEEIENWSLAQATAISAVSEQVKYSLVERGFDADKICVNPNGVDIDEYHPLPADEKKALRAELGFTPEHRVLCFVGTFGGWHGVEVLAAAMPRILERVPEARFLLIGDGNCKHLIDEAITAHGIQDKVVCSGRVPQQEGRRLLQAGDIYLSPHSGHMKTMRFFGSPTKLFEYMGMGGGIIATDLEQIGKVLRPALFAKDISRNTPPTVTNERAVLCKPGDVEEFTDACVYLAEYPEIAEKLGHNAREAAKKEFTWQAHVERLWKFVGGDTSASWENSEGIQTPQKAQTDRVARDLAGLEAQKQWNTNPCGAVEGLENLNLDYFLRVEANRYNLEGYIREVYPFDRFSGKNVLEVGCGHGTDSIQFARRGANCHVADITDRHLGLTIKNFELQGYPLVWKKCDATALDYPDDYFDCVYSYGVVHHIPNIQHVLQEMRRVLKPGGTLCLTVYNQLSAFHIFSKLLADGCERRKLFTLGYAGMLSTIEQGADGIHIRPYVKLYRKGQFKRTIEKAGFTVETIGVDNLMPSHFERWQNNFWPKWQKYAHILGWYVYSISKKPMN